MTPKHQNITVILIGDSPGRSGVVLTVAGAVLPI